MRCPFCANEDTQVVDTRSNEGTNVIRRRRKCPKCDKRFTTYERVELRMPRLVKKGGSRTDFDREKLVGSMTLALRKRPVATEEIDAAADRIEEKLRALGEREIQTSRVGDLVMRELARLDKIGYIRFASVYRSFESPDDFREAVQEVKTKKTQEVMPFTAFDRAMMARALELAGKGLYTTTPNPRVGCVLTQGEKVVGEGWHEKTGAPHAEANALAAAGAAAKGATAYVSLEPCNHHGRTPPCSQALINAGIKRVIAATRDPNPQAARGGEALSAAGVRFEHGLMEEEARELNIGFFSRMTRGRPWVRMKIAATLDGRTALSNGKSQWITGAEARKDGHRWRARACAILTGIGTVKADDPRLTVRDVETSRQPLRAVVDSRLEIADGAKVLDGGGTVIFCGVQKQRNLKAEVLQIPNHEGKVDLARMLKELAKRGVNELHVEAGFRLNGSLVREGCVDEFLIYLNPSLLGDTAQGMVDLPAFDGLDKRPKLKIQSLDRIGDDIRILARF